jgi:uncharacterized membrane protein
MNLNKKFNQWLICCMLFIATMLYVRMKFTGSYRFMFLPWNLFLAYIPYVLSQFFEKIYHTAKWKQVLLFVTWLLFFPNALYIVTDIIHLNDLQNVPIWFDAILLFTSSFAGLALAFASLIHVENFLKNYIPTKYLSLSVLLIIFAGAFGVYLGRFQRWNSWDVISEPLALGKDIAHRFTNPFAHVYSWAIVCFLTLLYSVYWYFLKTIVNISSVAKR